MYFIKKCLWPIYELNEKFVLRAAMSLCPLNQCLYFSIIPEWIRGFGGYCCDESGLTKKLVINETMFFATYIVPETLKS
jgi:hypothetical protein